MSRARVSQPSEGVRYGRLSRKELIVRKDRRRVLTTVLWARCLVVELSMFQKGRAPRSERVNLVANCRQVIASVGPVSSRAQYHRVSVYFDLNKVVKVSRIVSRPTIRIRRKAHRCLRIFYRPRLMVRYVVPVSRAYRFVAYFYFVLYRKRVNLRRALGERITVRRFNRTRAFARSAGFKSNVFRQ